MHDLVNLFPLILFSNSLIAGLSSTLTMLLMFQCILSIGKRNISTVLEWPSGFSSILNILVILGYLMCPCNSLLWNLLSLTCIFAFLSIENWFFFFHCRTFWQESFLVFLVNYPLLMIGRIIWPLYFPRFVFIGFTI
jgi:hypothetical protein